MIKSKADLKEYMAADAARYHLRKPFILGYFFGDESYVVLRHLRVMRHLEYYTNKRKKLFDYVPYAYYFFRFRRGGAKTGIRIGINTVGKGLYIPHYSGGVIVNCLHMGDNCIVTSGVVIGNKGDKENRATIGDNVEITLGAKIIGKVTIGNNVIIAPNSVVVKDVPDNCVVTGVPAKFLKYTNQK